LIEHYKLSEIVLFSI